MNRFFLIILLLVLSCKDKIDFNDNKLQLSLEKTLKEYNLSTNVKVKSLKNSINIDIIFPEKDIKYSGLERPYYFDIYSNKLLIKVLLKQYSKQIFKFEKINLRLDFSFFKDSITLKIGRIEKRHVLTYFSNKQFYNSVVFSFENFTPKDISFLDSQLRYITKFLDMKKIRYWELLKSISTNKGTNDIKLFNILIGNLKNNDYGLESKSILKKLLELKKINHITNYRTNNP